LKLASNWFQDCKTKEDRERREQLLRVSGAFAELLVEILEPRSRKSTKFNEYDTPAWQYKLAHRNGQQEELDFILSLLRPIVGINHDR
jgi:hypothetical protein